MAHREEDDVRLNDVVSDASESDEGSESEASSSEDEQLSASMSSRAARRRVVGDESVGSMSQRGMQESSDAGKSEQSGKYGERRPSRSDPSPPPPLKRATSGLKSAAQVYALAPIDIASFLTLIGLGVLRERRKEVDFSPLARKARSRTKS